MQYAHYYEPLILLRDKVVVADFDTAFSEGSHAALERGHIFRETDGHASARKPRGEDVELLTARPVSGRHSDATPVACQASDEVGKRARHA